MPGWGKARRTTEGPRPRHSGPKRISAPFLCSPLFLVSWCWRQIKAEIRSRFRPLAKIHKWSLARRVAPNKGPMIEWEPLASNPGSTGLRPRNAITGSCWALQPLRLSAGIACFRAFGYAGARVSAQGERFQSRIMLARDKNVLFHDGECPGLISCSCY